MAVAAAHRGQLLSIIYFFIIIITIITITVFIVITTITTIITIITFNKIINVFINIIIDVRPSIIDSIN